MALGFSKDFVIFLFIAVIASLAFENWNVGFAFLLIYAPIKIIWKFLT